MTTDLTALLAVEGLLPCPFCGGEAKLWHQTRHNRGTTYVMCDDSMCMTEKGGAGRTKAEREAAAIEAWNRRFTRQSRPDQGWYRARIMETIGDEVLIGPPPPSMCIWVCSSPHMRHAYTSNPLGHCPRCAEAGYGNWSCVSVEVRAVNTEPQ